MISIKLKVISHKLMHHPLSLLKRAEIYLADRGIHISIKTFDLLLKVESKQTAKIFRGPTKVHEHSVIPRTNCKGRIQFLSSQHIGQMSCEKLLSSVCEKYLLAPMDKTYTYGITLIVNPQSLGFICDQAFSNSVLVIVSLSIPFHPNRPKQIKTKISYLSLLPRTELQW
ncbi:hypothetical protein FGO68_gene8342 [Halteria grandinella]|uniref:Uncharacterized protein n=1 Tax=Halteria grandinella TaxID=5974 RepID=A0A8J8NW84_HALGN|nr:hypothetical protein FGO68_gene8342 [Halteria grandinella]